MSLAERTLRTSRFLAADPIRSARTAPSPHEVIHRQNKAALRYFAPRTPKATAAPVFVSMPLINQWYIWDLLPGHSVVERLTRAGVPVYLLDWGKPGPEDADTTLSTLLDRVLHRSMDRARRHARQHHGAEALDAVGYCVGGTFLAIYLGQEHQAARRACFVATPIDFHASGRLATWASPGNFPVDEAVSGFGNYPGAIIRDAFAWLKPSGQTRKWMSLWERVDQDGFPELWAALERWSADSMDFPGEAYREYVKRCYFENALMQDEPAWSMANREVHLRDVRIPAHAIAAKGDHIVPPAAAFGLEKAWGGPVTTQIIRGGHVGICVSGDLADALVAWAAP